MKWLTLNWPMQRLLKLTLSSVQLQKIKEDVDSDGPFVFAFEIELSMNRFNVQQSEFSQNAFAMPWNDSL